MRLTLEICYRLLGFGGGGAGEKVEAHDAAPAKNRRKGGGSSQHLDLAMGRKKEGLNGEERARRRAEKRRAKRKRQKQRRRLEKERQEDASEQDQEVTGESHSEDDVNEEDQENQEWTCAQCRSTETRNNQNQACRSPEEEPEWDVSCAFVANAAGHIRLKALKSKTAKDKGNEAGGSQMMASEERKRRGQSLTVQGIQMFERGQYDQAVVLFTEALSCDPNDHRFYGNRSYCFWCLDQCNSALTDALKSTQLAPDWPKGHFRKGCALMGLKRYREAEEAMEQVLKLDRHCREASSKLFTCRVFQLMVMGFEEEQSKNLLDKYSTIEAVINSPEAKMRKTTPQQELAGSCPSIWIGNISVEITEQDLWDLFRPFGEIESIRLLHQRFCAFVDFQNANMAAEALKQLWGVELKSNHLILRYPERWLQQTPPVTQRPTSSLNANVHRTQKSLSATG